MDEAERCERIVYLSDGRIVVQGAPDQVARNSGLVTYEATGEAVDEAARRLREMSGIEAAAAEPSLPFFIEWERGARHPGGGGARRPVELQLEGDGERLAAWLGPHALPVTIRPGRPRVANLAVDGRVVL